MKKKNNKLKPTKIPKNLKNRVYFGLLLGYYGHFQRFQGYFVYFCGFNGILVNLKVFGVIVIVLGVFWSFSKILGYFGHSWCILVILAVLRGVISKILMYLYIFFDILVFLTGKLIFLWQKNTLQIIRMAIMLSKLPKYPKTTKCPEV